MAHQPVDPAWKHLGALLTRRRVELDPRYTNRRVFCEEKEIDYRVISDIEGGRRDNYSGVMITAIEVAYQLTPGSIDEILVDPRITEFRHRTGTGTLNLPLEPPAVDIPPGVSLQDVEDWERAIWLVPGLSAEERGLAIAAVRYWRDPKEERNMEQLWLRMLPPMIRRLPELLQQEQDGERGKNGTPRAS